MYPVSTAATLIFTVYTTSVTHDKGNAICNYRYIANTTMYVS